MKNTQSGFAIGIVVAIVAILAVGGSVTYYAVSKSKAGKADKAAKTENESKLSENVSANGSVHMDTGASASAGAKVSLEEVTRGVGQYVCTFSIKDANTESSGKTYIDGKLIRSDFTSTIKMLNQTVKSSSIISGGYSYTWSDVTPMGYKIPAVNTSPAASMMGIPVSGKVSANGADAAYECKTWKADSSVFTPPANIQFVSSPAAR